MRVVPSKNARGMDLLAKQSLSSHFANMLYYEHQEPIGVLELYDFFEWLWNVLRDLEWETKNSMVSVHRRW